MAAEWSSLKTRYDQLCGIYQQVQRDHDRTEREIAEKKALSQSLQEAQQLLQHLQTVLVDKSIREIEQFVTDGLHKVFFDQNLHFKVEQSIERGRTSLAFHIMSGDVVMPLMGSFGGGVVCIVGFLLRLLTVLKLGLRKFLFLDETFAHLSEKYVPYAGRLLRQLAEQTGVKIFLVTHQSGFLEAAHTEWVADSSSHGLVLTKEPS